MSGLRYESGRDMPPGMQALVADNWVKEVQRILDALAGMAAVLLGVQRAVIIDAIHMIEQMEVGE